MPPYSREVLGDDLVHLGTDVLPYADSPVMLLLIGNQPLLKLLLQHLHLLGTLLN